MRSAQTRQQGSTLIVSLIMLVLMTLIAVVTFNIGKSDLLIVGNMQYRAEGLSSAKATIEEVISRPLFTTNPNAPIVGGCAGNKKCFDINGDNSNDVTVTLAPAPCVKKVRILKNAELDLVNRAEDRACSLGETQTQGIEGSASGNSICADSTWEITAAAMDNITQTSVTAVQGVSMRVKVSDADPTYFCH